MRVLDVVSWHLRLADEPWSFQGAGAQNDRYRQADGQCAQEYKTLLLIPLPATNPSLTNHPPPLPTPTPHTPTCICTWLTYHTKLATSLVLGF
ncbi:hypothetical protein ABKN59_004245 [Abortiporus biennis]